MGRERKFRSSRHLTVVAGTEEEAEHRLRELHQMARPTVGRPVRIDRLREAMAIGDDIPPTPEKEWRKVRRQRREEITPRREALAAERLTAICAARGDLLTISNATRIIEQARAIVDRTRGISPEDRKNIEGARRIIDMIHRVGGSLASMLAPELAIVRRASRSIRPALGISERDRELRRQLQEIIRHSVH